MDLRYGTIDGGVGGGAEKSELGDADPKDVLDQRDLVGKTTLEASGDQRIDLARSRGASFAKFGSLANAPSSG